MRRPRLKSVAQSVLNKFGYALVKNQYQTTTLPHDMDPGFQEIYEKTRPYTMTSIYRMYEAYK